jgi:nucleoid-associated protein EbfC
MLPKGQMQSLMKQAQKMQQEMEKAQAELENLTVEGSAGGGMVVVEATGKKHIKSIRIAPEVMQEDVEMVEDLILAAVNQAIQKAEDLEKGKMGSMLGGKIPGFGF